MELKTAATIKQIRSRVETHMNERPFDIENVQVETTGGTEKDEQTRVRVWLEQTTDDPPNEYKDRSSSTEWNALKELRDDINQDTTLPEEVGAGNVSANRVHLQIVFPKGDYDSGKFCH